MRTMEVKKYQLIVNHYNMINTTLVDKMKFGPLPIQELKSVSFIDQKNKLLRNV